jgi:hypothetical protein
MRAPLFIFAMFAWATMSPAQEILSGSEPGTSPILFNGDAAVLETGDLRKDISCMVKPIKPELGFDLKFHSGYQVAVPLHELEGTGNNLSILFRVTPNVKTIEPVYFVQQVRVPPIEEKASGEATLQGEFDLGAGSYHVDWLMRDTVGRYCSSFWDLEAALSSKDRQVAVALPPQVIQRTEDDHFQPEPPAQREPDQSPINIKILMNFAPTNPAAAALDPRDTAALVSILRTIARHPRIGTLSLTAFDIQEQREFYRQEFSDHLDFPALGEAIKRIKTGTVGVSQLARKHGDTEFLSNLVRNEATNSHPDALVFVGPKAMLETSVPQEELKEVGELDYPVFYMNYNQYPRAVPWRDAIGRVVKFFKGREFTISGPRDLWNAMSEMVSRTTESRQLRTSGTNP